MQTDPMEEWRRLTALYSEMGELEIRDLASQINDLTPNAQQILRDELKKRGISETPSSSAQGRQGPLLNSAEIRWNSEEDRALNSDEDGATEYTWKTALYRSDSEDEANLRCEMLRRAGIDSWLQKPGSRFAVPWDDDLGDGAIQINVAADQLEQALAIVAQPIPQDIINEQKELEASPGYEVPVCPKCGAEDPTLESVEPTNNWLCESCGHNWSDPVPDPTAGP